MECWVVMDVKVFFEGVWERIMFMFVVFKEFVWLIRINEISVVIVGWENVFGLVWRKKVRKIYLLCLVIVFDVIYICV